MILGTSMRMEIFPTRIPARFPARYRCACCGLPVELHLRRAGRRFCIDCLERARSHDVDDPYDEIGGGD